MDRGKFRTMKFDKTKSENVLLYIVNKLNEPSVTFHKLFKILYFAELYHLSKYGRLISGDEFIAMKRGPVPSKIYDYLKPGFFSSSKKTDYLTVENNYYVSSDNQCDLDELSESEVESLDKSISAIKDLNFKQREDKSHGPAWNKTKRNKAISVYDMAEEMGMTDDMMQYIETCTENDSILS